MRTKFTVTISALLAVIIAAAGIGGCTGQTGNTDPGKMHSDASPVPAFDTAGAEEGSPDAPRRTTSPVPSSDPSGTPGGDTGETGTEEIKTGGSGTEGTAPTGKPSGTEETDYSGGIKAEGRKSTAALYENGAKEAYCGTGHIIAMQFRATAAFSSVGFESPTWTAKEGYNVEYSLYKWAGDYDSTMTGKPVATAFLEDWQDGVLVPLEAESLPAGEYILAAEYGSTAAMCNSGVWFVNAECPYQRAYLDDEIWYDVSVCAKLTYVDTPNNKYGPLSDSGLE